MATPAERDYPATVPAAWTVGRPLRVPDASLARLILAQARRRPDATAVRQWEQTLTYRELVAGAGALASRLTALGAGPEERVAVCLRRRPPLLTGILGVLFAGAAYLPVDPLWPARRRAETLDDAGAGIVVVDADTAPLFAGSGRTLVDVAEVHGAQDLPPDPGPARPGHAAYVIYTSGSTGRPKGVVVEHRAVVAHVVGVIEHFGLTEDDHTLAFAAAAFDVSVGDFFCPLAAGAQLCLTGDADRADPGRLQHFLREHGVTWGWLAPAMLPFLDPAGLPAWRTVLTAGEAPSPDQVERWTAGTTGRRYFNCWGPTEIVLAGTGYRASGRWDRPVPMGGPFPGYTVYIVDEKLRQVPPGVEGEIVVGGASVARGYLGQPARTAAVFVPDPFGDVPGARLYRTGDRGLWLPDGALMFRGRADRQVKIRGQRVELGEVEAALAAHPGVRHAAAETVDGPTGRDLVAFVVTAGHVTSKVTGKVTGEVAGEAPVGAAALRRFCQERLPAVAVPARLIDLPRLPLTPTGKIDREALRRLAGPVDQPVDQPADGSPHRPAGVPGDPAEVVAELWGRLLGEPEPETDSDFFTAGGHSITAIRLVAAIRDRLGVAVGVTDVFGGRTLGGVTDRVLAALPLESAGPPTGSPPELSAAQRRLWFLDQLDPDAAAYNIGVAERLVGPVDLARLGRALAAVARRQAVLRWRVVADGGVPRVMVDPAADPADLSALPVEDMSALEPAEREAVLRERLADVAAKRFDLAAGPVWRAGVVRLGDDEVVLWATFHHLVFDGWAQAPFYDDLAEAYRRDAPLPEPAVGFADYVAWRVARDGARGADDVRWWAESLSGSPDVLDLPTDRPRPPVQTYRGALVDAELPQSTVDTVRTLARSLGTTSSSVLLAALAEVLRRVTGQDDLVVGTVAADRRDAAFEPLVGFFVDILPLRLRMPAGHRFADLVTACRDGLLAGLAHPAAPLDQVVQALRLPRDPARPPLVQVLFNVYNFPEPRLRLPGVTATRVPTGVPGSPFDLTVYVVERGPTLAVEMTYNPDLFDEARIRLLLRVYGDLLAAASADPDGAASAVPLPGSEALRAGSEALRADSGAARVDSGAEVPGPASDTIANVAAVWRAVLGHDRFTVTDNFFDVGGTSMAAVEVHARLAEAGGGRLRVVDLFRYPTVRALAGYLAGLSGPPGSTGDTATDTATDTAMAWAGQRAAARRERSRGRGRTSTGKTGDSQ